MKLVLHIGTEKTGTTSLQRWVIRNREALIGEGSWPCEALGLPDNRALAVMARKGDDPEDGFYRFGIHSPEQHAAFVERTRHALAEEVRAASDAGARVFLISNEHLQSRLYSQEMVDRVAEEVKRLFDDIEVICVLRPQIDAVLSLASTEARVGMKVNRRRFEWVDPAVHYFNYLGLLQRWAGPFGAERVLPIPFRRQPNIVAFFRSYFKLKRDDYVTLPRSNQGLDYRAVAFSNILDLHVFQSEGVVNPNRTIFFDDLPMEESLTLSRDFAQELHARFVAGNAAIAAAWPSITAEDLTPDWSRYPEVGTVDLLDTCDIGPVMRYVVQRLNAELHIARAQTEHQRARAAQAHGRLDNAVAFLEKADRKLDDAALFAPMAERAKALKKEFGDTAARVRAKAESKSEAER